MIDAKCVAGCKYFSGQEVRHHKDCAHYEGSFSEMFDKQEAELRAARRVVEAADRFDAMARKHNYPGHHGPQELADAFEALRDSYLEATQ